jgi:hypothetical protein
VPNVQPCEPPVLVHDYEDLDTKLKRLLAERLNVAPSQITPEFINRFRESHMYHELRVDFSNRYGGFNPPGEVYFTEKQVDELRSEIEEYLNSLV